MNKPKNYDECRVVVQNVPYRRAENGEEYFEATTMSEGVLGKGQIVWINGRSTFAYWVSAYVPEIGVTIVDSRFLVRPIDPNLNHDGPNIPEKNMWNASDPMEQRQS
jgi:hypothetical protein